MSDDANAPAAPIEVAASVGPAATWQTARVLILFGCGLVFQHFLTSETVMVAGMAAATAVVTYGYGLVQLARTHHTLKTLVAAVPDELARLKA
ncbi:MAG TPA: hypothetical protein VG939_05020 [Caulobacteraceae bacterium]|nr:hypothetical protein [Caulobacteraceae bacterium]